ncbi:MAG: ribosome-recycling factor [Patescibacteria group bacterium]|nr:MAG: ribosome-recycling factor [Patescibacteria group bacterium]
MNELITEFKQNSLAIIEKLKQELLSIRTGRASPALLENIKVTVYQGSTQLRLIEIATITTQDPQTLLVIPFDPTIIQEIETSLNQSELGFRAVLQGKQLIIKIPPLTEEQRQKYIKLVGKIVEEHREFIRQERDRVRKIIKTSTDNKEIPEEEKFRLFEEIDKINKDLNEKIQDIKTRKESELATV